MRVLEITLLAPPQHHHYSTHSQILMPTHANTSPKEQICCRGWQITRNTECGMSEAASDRMMAFKDWM